MLATFSTVFRPQKPTQEQLSRSAFKADLKVAFSPKTNSAKIEMLTVLLEKYKCSPEETKKIESKILELGKKVLKTETQPKVLIHASSALNKLTTVGKGQIEALKEQLFHRCLKSADSKQNKFAMQQFFMGGATTVDYKLASTMRGSQEEIDKAIAYVIQESCKKADSPLDIDPDKLIRLTMGTSRIFESMFPGLTPKEARAQFLKNPNFSLRYPEARALVELQIQLEAQITPEQRQTLNRSFSEEFTPAKRGARAIDSTAPLPGIARDQVDKIKTSEATIRSQLGAKDIARLKSDITQTRKEEIKQQSTRLRNRFNAQFGTTAKSSEKDLANAMLELRSKNPKEFEKTRAKLEAVHDEISRELAPFGTIENYLSVINANGFSGLTWLAQVNLAFKESDRLLEGAKAKKYDAQMGELRTQESSKKNASSRTFFQGRVKTKAAELATKLGRVIFGTIYGGTRNAGEKLQKLEAAFGKDVETAFKLFKDLGKSTNRTIDEKKKASFGTLKRFLEDYTTEYRRLQDQARDEFNIYTRVLRNSSWKGPDFKGSDDANLMVAYARPGSSEELLFKSLVAPIPEDEAIRRGKKMSIEDMTKWLEDLSLFQDDPKEDEVYELTSQTILTLAIRYFDASTDAATKTTIEKVLEPYFEYIEQDNLTLSQIQSIKDDVDGEHKWDEQDEGIDTTGSDETTRPGSRLSQSSFGSASTMDADDEARFLSPNQFSSTSARPDTQAAVKWLNKLMQTADTMAPTDEDITALKGWYPHIQDEPLRNDLLAKFPQHLAATDGSDDAVSFA